MPPTQGWWYWAGSRPVAQSAVAKSSTVLQGLHVVGLDSVLGERRGSRRGDLTDLLGEEGRVEPGIVLHSEAKQLAVGETPRQAMVSTSRKSRAAARR